MVIDFGFLVERFRKEWDLVRSRAINTDSVRTVCMVLGPYRNLTTLTASVLFLHPKCQVLNHGGQRVFGDSRLDWIAHYDDKVFENFLRYSIYISKGGRRGQYGGSIVHSYAFDEKYNTSTLFREAALGLVKENIESLFWKDSLRISNHIRSSGVELFELLEKEPRIRFLMPIRNPMDCAKSNILTGHVGLFGRGLEQQSEEDVLELILDEILWFKRLQSSEPNRFYDFFEFDLGWNVLVDMEKFLCLTPNAEWASMALKACSVESKYDHSDSFVSYFRDSVTRKFAEYPEFADNMLKFAAGAT
ncbi:hypothetical protein [Methylococcus capsulatus]|uniref:hypothetical protein n=1 Tax=Methylococcus capsulatus TaxID=414 RepID=UPI0012B59B3F|nr:hypothetical protein [Methylococcus capsulatus]